MPRDGDLSISQLRLSKLSAALRRQMPDDFEWHYEVVTMPIARYAIRYQGKDREVCGTAGCAMGLAYNLMGPRSVPPIDHDTVVNWAIDHFKLPDDIFQSIFYGGDQNKVYGMMRRDVTPGMVATVIDRYLATGSLPSPWPDSP